MKNKIIWLVVAVVVVGGYFVLNKKGELQADKPIKIGALLILSGDFGQYGESSRNAIQMAVNEYNSVPGNNKKVEIVFEDTKADPKTAVSAYRKLTTLDKVDVIVGPLLQVEMSAIEPLVKQDQVPMFSVAPIPVNQRGAVANPLVIWPDPTLEAGQMAMYVYNEGVRKVGILNTKDAWESEVSDAFSKKFKELGGTITGQEVVLPDSEETSLPVTKILSTKPDAIFVGTYYKFVYFVKKIKELGYKGKLYSIEIDTSLSDLTKPYSDGLQFISPAFYTPDFVEQYTKIYGVAPSIPVGQAYDATNLALSIINRSNSKNEILLEMGKIREFSGVSGKIEFSENHRATFPLSIFEIQNGKINKVK